MTTKPSQSGGEGRQRKARGAHREMIFGCPKSNREVGINGDVNPCPNSRTRGYCLGRNFDIRGVHYSNARALVE